MPANTSPDNIVYPVVGDQVAPLEAAFQDLAESVQGALDDSASIRQLRSYRWADTTARSATTGMQSGDRGYQTDINRNFVYTGSMWIAPTARAVLRRTTSQSVSSGGNNAIQFTTQDYLDPGYQHSTSVNNTRITVDNTGIYQLAAAVTWPSNTTGTRRFGYAINGGTRIDMFFNAPPAAAVYPQSAVAPAIALAAGDYIEVVTLHTAGTNLSITGEASLTRIDA